jgi:excisionase family DNA binding protein
MMVAINENDLGSVAPTENDARLAVDSSRQLHRIMAAKRGRKTMNVTVEADGADGESITVPASALRLFAALLTEMGKGNAVTLIPTHAELTTQQAADVLKVSRPFVVEQIEKGLIKHRMVGTHRRILFSDLMEYKRSMDVQASKAMDELAVQAQELEMGY